MGKYIVFSSDTASETVKNRLSSVSAPNGFYPIYSSMRYYELGQDTSKFPEWAMAVFVYGSSVFYATSEGERKLIDNGRIVIPEAEIRGSFVPAMTLSVRNGLRISTLSSEVGSKNGMLSDMLSFTDGEERHSEISPDSHTWQGGMRLAYEGDEHLKQHDKDIEELQRQTFGNGIFEYSDELPSGSIKEFFDKYAFVVSNGTCYVRSSLSEEEAVYSSSGDFKNVFFVYDGSSVSFREKPLSQIEATPVDIVW